MKKSVLISISVLLLAALLSLGACGDNSSPGTSGDTRWFTPTFVEMDYPFTGTASNMFMSGENLYFICYEYTEESGSEAVLYRSDLEGHVTRLNMPPAAAVPEGWEGYTNYSYMTGAPDGNIYLISNAYTYRYDTPAGWVESADDPAWNYDYIEGGNIYSLIKLDTEGNLLSSTELNELLTTNDYGYVYVNGLQVDKEGNVYLMCEQTLCVLNSEGELLFTLNEENWLNNIFTLHDGTVAVSYYGDAVQEFKTVDLAAKAWGKSTAMPPSAWQIYPGRGDYDFYFTNGSNFFGYKAAGETTDKLFNWINCDMNPDDVYSLAVTEDGRIITLVSEWDAEYIQCTNSIAILTETATRPGADKTTLTLATQSMSWELRNQIISFNRKSPDYRIEVLDYSEYNTEDDYSAGLTKLTTDISAGQMPDIIDLSGLDYKTYAAQGLLTDLLPLLDADKELSRDDIMPAVLQAMCIDGKLYQTASYFSIQAVLGLSSVVGTTPGWTVEQFQQAYAQMPQGATVFDETVTRDEVLYYSLALDLDNFVDWESGECYFDGEGFIGLLEFVNSFPSDFDWENYDWETAQSAQERLASGKQMLMTASIYDFLSINEYWHTLGEGQFTYIGFPTSYGVGNMMYIDSGLAISSKCKDVDGAWSFLRSYFSEDSVTNYGWGLPINKKAYEKAKAEAMTPEYQTDMNGNFILDENGNKIEQPKYSYGDSSGNMYEVYALTQEQVDKLEELINSTTRTYSTNEKISQIINEEAAAYFSGAKSAEETAKMVQSRVKTYVSEQM